MPSEEQQAVFTGLATLMASVVSNYLVHRDMPAPYLEALVQHINSALQEMDTVVESDDGC